MLYDITTLQSIGLNCMVKTGWKHTKNLLLFSETQETEKGIYLFPTIVKGERGMTKIYQASLNYNWKSKTERILCKQFLII